MNLIDMHCDTISKIMSDGTIALRKNDLMVDLEKLRQGDYLLQCFAMFIHYLPSEENPKYSPLEEVLKMIDCFYREMDANRDLIRPVTTVNEILKNREAGLLSALLTVEEGGVCLGRIEILRDLYRLGVRMLTLTWNYRNELAYPNSDYTPGMPEDEMKRARDSRIPETEHGLTETGIEFVREMNRLGMIIDCSHLGDAGFYDVVKYSKKPIVCSHSCARALCSHVRNMTDDMLKALKENGGVVGINYNPPFVTDEDRTVGVEDLADHIFYIRDLIGIDHIGLGSDYDGISNKKLSIKTAAQMGELIDELSRRGLAGSDIDKVTHENVLRVFKDNFGA